MFKLRFEKIINWLLPTFCALCRKNTANKALCQSCLNDLPWQDHACALCGSALSSTEICGQCIQNPPPYDSTICLFHYQAPIDSMILSLKFADNLRYAKLLGNLMAEKIASRYREHDIPIQLEDTGFVFSSSNTKPGGFLRGKSLVSHLNSTGYTTRHPNTSRTFLRDNALTEASVLKGEWYKPEWIIPVPLHAERLRERGYNQALEIARPIAKKLQIPLQTRYCTRILPTLAQASMTAEERRRNMKNAFAVEELFQARHVAIVDDVLTTGSTVSEFARMLKKSGVARVDVWCCARTVLRF
jgi:ComF family protein